MGFDFIYICNETLSKFRLGHKGEDTNGGPTVYL